LLERLVRRTRAPFAALVRGPDVDVVSTSPELFLELEPGRIARTVPIKGTRPRHDDPERDRALAAELDADPKERAELAMVIDVERNDLGRLCLAGSIRLQRPPGVTTYPTVHHREGSIAGVLRPEVSRTELLESMLPSGSVTGAPKVSAMDVIAALEAARRGLYTGALGYVDHDGGMRLSMAIRTATLRAGQGHYFSGGGIVADSDPEREVSETGWKALQLTELESTESAHEPENWAESPA
jgi:anthranilate/para-aminobenzoate synthase component I